MTQALIPPRRRLGRLVGMPLIWAIRGYQYAISPVLPMACRYQPTCSAYAAEAIGRHGALVGGWLALRRILRCHPWGGHGWDPVPPPRRAHPHAVHPHAVHAQVPDHVPDPCDQSARR